jgi:hypothetical protein
MSPEAWEAYAHTHPGWPPWLWFYHEYTEVHFAAGVLQGLIAKAPGILKLPDYIAACWGPVEAGDASELANHGCYHSRVWLVYKAMDGEYYLVRSNAALTEWDPAVRLFFVPSGAYNPSICFDEAGQYVIAAEFQPAGGAIELWLYSFPYQGVALRKIVDGANLGKPVVGLDPSLDLLYFYTVTLNELESEIHYRAKSEAYATIHTLPLEAKGIKSVNAVFTFYRPNLTPPGKADYYLDSCCIYATRELYPRYITTWHLISNPYLITPAPIETGNPYAAILELSWVDIGAISRAYTETESAEAGIQLITWAEIIVINDTRGESASPDATVQSLTWAEIILVEDSREESADPSATIQSLLWVEA